VHELLLLLQDSEGNILEGASSNFFVLLSDGKIETADAGILSGSMRKLVLGVADKNGIPVSYKAPRFDESDRWQAAFLTSTSRLVLPIDEIVGVSGKIWRPVDIPDDHSRGESNSTGGAKHHPTLLMLLRGVEDELKHESGFDIGSEGVVAKST